MFDVVFQLDSPNIGRFKQIGGYIYIYLVGGLEHFLFSIIYGIILPIDFHIFQRGGYTTNQRYIDIYIYTHGEGWRLPDPMLPLKANIKIAGMGLNRIDVYGQYMRYIELVYHGSISYFEYGLWSSNK